MENINKYLRGAIIAGLFAVPFIPFIVSSSLFFPFITGKGFVFRILVEIIVGLWAILAMRDKAYRPVSSVVLAAFASFVVIMFLADLNGENPFKSIWSNYERMEGWVTIVHLFGYFIVMSSVLRNWLWTALFNTTLATSAIMTFYSYLQHGGAIAIDQGDRLDATLGNATYLAIYLVFHIFLALIQFMRTKLSYRYIYLALIAFELPILYYTATRGAILGLLGGVFVASFIALFGEKNDTERKVIMGGFIGVLLIVGGFFLIKDSQFVQHSPVLSRFASISLNESKTQARGYIWPMAIEGFKERPILGWGQENFNYIFNKNYNPEMYAHEAWFDRTHNVVLDWLVAGGLLGLLAYLSLFIGALWMMWRRSEFTFNERAVYTGLFAAYFFHNLFVFDNITSYILFVMVLAYIHSGSINVSDTKNVQQKNAPKDKKNALDSEVMSNVATPIIIIATLFCIWYVNIRVINANTNLIQAISPHKAFAENLDYFKKSLSTKTFGDQEAREQLVQMAFKLHDEKRATDVERKGVYDFAVSQMEIMLQEAPNDARHSLFLGALYSGYGDYVNAEKYLKRALQLSPKKQAIYAELGNVYLRSGNTEAGLEVMKAEFDLAPSYDDARFAYATAAIFAGKYALTESLMQERYGMPFYPDERLLQAYIATKQFAKVAGLWEAKIILDTKSGVDLARNHAGLGTALANAGQPARAIEELNKAINMELDPNAKKQYVQYLNYIKTGKKDF